MIKLVFGFFLVTAIFLGGCSDKPASETTPTDDQPPKAVAKEEKPESEAEPEKESLAELAACREMAKSGFRPIANSREERFLGKVTLFTAECRGGEKVVKYRLTPWNDWANYWATGDQSSKGKGLLYSGGHLGPNGRGIDGALLDLEYQRIELIKFNLFDNHTFETYLEGREGIQGPAVKVWPEMRLAKDHPAYQSVGGDQEQLCKGDQIRSRTLTGICNDIKNPAMGATNMLFARNIQFEETFPRLTGTELQKNRHGDRLGLLKPDPQLISRKLFTRSQSQPDKCAEGFGLEGNSPEANCDYKKAPFFNVLAAFWIQFMTHDWFSHLNEGANQPEYMQVGCDDPALGCRPDDQMEKALVADDSPPASFSYQGKKYLKRAPKTFKNTVTAWWDASQIYGYDEISLKRVKRDPQDPAKLLMVPQGSVPGAGEKFGYLPLLQASDPMNPAWAGQAATAFPDNWTVGVAFYHNLFSREHNAFVDAFRAQAAKTPEADSGLRHPARADQAISYQDVSADELFEIARLVVSAGIAKIHTIEWTTQLLYNEPLFRGMNSNWGGLFGEDSLVAKALERIVVNNYGKTEDVKRATQWYSVFASGPGIFGLGSRVYEDDSIFAKIKPKKKDIWSLTNPEHINGGVNHFGSPFNFPEEFTTVYRLHPLVPDLLEYREWQNDPNQIRSKIPVVTTFRGKATEAMREKGLANWALSMGRQRLGLLTLQNHAQFLQNLEMPRLKSPTKKIDVAALDLIRDRERGVPRFNEFRRQYGLKQLTSFDDFIDQRLPEDSPARKEQQQLVQTLREVYGQHRCDASKVITNSQVNEDGSAINDCLGHADGSMVDNVEDIDTVVGWLAEFTRPHGFAISETQFVVFILNASRRLFSDRFFTSSFRPEFYTQFGVDWVNNNGPGEKQFEKGEPNGHKQEVSPLKRVLLRTTPELADQLDPVVNVFDPWARDRGSYYSLEWKPLPSAKSDPAFNE